MRLIAERDNATEIKVPSDLQAKIHQAEVADYVQSERALFVARRQTIDGQKDQLKRERWGGRSPL